LRDWVFALLASTFFMGLAPPLPDHRKGSSKTVMSFQLSEAGRTALLLFLGLGLVDVFQKETIN
jgi:hypothetical protein